MSRETTGSRKDWFRMSDMQLSDWKDMYHQMPLRKITIETPRYVEKGEEFKMHTRTFVAKENWSVQICPQCKYEFKMIILEIPSISNLFDVLGSISRYHVMVDFYCPRCSPG